MIAEIKKLLALRLKKLYPKATIYDEYMPKEFKTPCFFVTTEDINYKKAIANKYNVSIKFMIAIFTDQELVNNDFDNKQMELSRNLKLDNFKIKNINFKKVDKELHMMITINYTEKKVYDSIKLNSIEKINSDIKE